MSCFWLRARQASLDVLHAHLPLGMAWEAFRIVGKVAYRLVAAFAESYEDAWEALCNLAAELDPRTTSQMLAEWETALSLPDACLPVATTVAERRAWIIWRLEKRRWTTAQDWKDLAALFGLTIDVTPGWYVQKISLWGDFRFPMAFNDFPKLGRFRVYIDITNIDFPGFEYGASGTNADVGFPIPFGNTDDRVTQFMCLIDRIRPANTIVLWNEFPVAAVCTHATFSETFSDAFC